MTKTYYETTWAGDDGDEHPAFVLNVRDDILSDVVDTLLGELGEVVDVHMEQIQDGGMLHGMVREEIDLCVARSVISDFREMLQYCDEVRIAVCDAVNSRELLWAFDNRIVLYSVEDDEWQGALNMLDFVESRSSEDTDQGGEWETHFNRLVDRLGATTYE